MVRENSFCVYQRQNVAFFLYVANYSTGMFQKGPSDNTLVYVANYSTGMFQKRPSDNILVMFVCVSVCSRSSWVVLSTVLLCHASSVGSVFFKKKLISNTHEKKKAHNTKQVSFVHTKVSYPLTSGHSIVQACAKEEISLHMRLKQRLPWHVIMGLR